MSARITATRASRSFSELLDRVRYRGERYTITRGGEVVAELGPPHGPMRGPTLRELTALLAALPPPDPAFADDLEAARAARPALPEDPWES